MPPANLYLGIDVGTSGVRAMVVDARGELAASSRAELSSPAAGKQDSGLWWQALQDCLSTLSADARARVKALAISGTSGTLLLADSELQAVGPACMYNSAGFDAEAELIAGIAPSAAADNGSNSALARLLHLQRQDAGQRAHGCYAQAHWLASKLARTSLACDANNMLKLGYDPAASAWPNYYAELGVAELLPAVVAPGATIGRVHPEIARTLGMNPGCRICAGTTDSVAAFIATGASEVGAAVSSIGTTIALKIIGEQPVNSSPHGVYSHWLRGQWLASGASNAGAGVLRHYFSDRQLRELSARIDPELDCDLGYYPLLRAGERFPVNDPQLAPNLEPRPQSDVEFLHGIFSGLARIEAQGYATLQRLGAPQPKYIYSCGGASNNPTFTRIRARTLNIELRSPQNSEAAYGSALLALESRCSGTT